MGANSKIEWTDATWNPILGCSRVSEGCRNCYAERMAGRFRTNKKGLETVYSDLTQIVNGKPVWSGEIRETRALLDPLKWKSPKRIFVNSMSDLFHENVTDGQRDRIFAVMALCPQHTFQVLTKRPERMLKYMTHHYRVVSPGPREAVFGIVTQMRGYNREHPEWLRLVCKTSSSMYEPLPNVWLGVSVENQAAVDERIPLLLQTPAAIRFISAEPLLGPVHLDRIREEPEGYLNALAAVVHCDGRGTKSITGLDWVICGGESGPAARPMHPDWARSLRDQCAIADVPFFFKRWGEWAEVDGGPPNRVFDVDKQHAPIDRTNCVIALDGHTPRVELELRDGAKYRWMSRAGKKAAGSLLDGIEHKNFPEARPCQ
jgi:protein gp37